MYSLGVGARFPCPAIIHVTTGGQGNPAPTKGIHIAEYGSLIHSAMFEIAMAFFILLKCNRDVYLHANTARCLQQRVMQQCLRRVNFWPILHMSSCF